MSNTFKSVTTSTPTSNVKRARTGNKQIIEDSIKWCLGMIAKNASHFYTTDK